MGDYFGYRRDAFGGGVSCAVKEQTVFIIRVEGRRVALADGEGFHFICLQRTNPPMAVADAMGGFLSISHSKMSREN
ncbi:hypothetical protein EAI80_00935 [Catenibacterium sp. co_0103]|nr:hypothetical protein EAI80_00935 [Catenibacterium sp. co_0103]